MHNGSHVVPIDTATLAKLNASGFTAPCDPATGDLILDANQWAQLERHLSKLVTRAYARGRRPAAWVTRISAVEFGWSK